MRKLILAGLFSVAALATAPAFAASDFVIFKNNTSETWTLGPESMSGGTWQLRVPSPAVAGSTKSGWYSAPDRTFTSYSSSWSATDGTVCSFSSWAGLNSFGNMQFHTSSSSSGARSGTGSGKVVCSTVTPGSNFDGSYDFNHAIAISP